MTSLSTGRLPVRLVPLVGRQCEIQDVVDSLSRSRLLTLTGPGGTGKTRLALAAADAARASFAGGACWVELAPVDDPAIVARAVASQLGVLESPGQDVTETIAGHVGDGSMLMVLDNCEHLTAAVAELAERLLGVCPALSILTTSREILGVDGERSWPVPPLSLPRAEVAPAACVLAGFDAIKLFEQRAQLVLPSFRLTDDNAAAVLQVCCRLDGLPLAIELAAARMRILSAGQLAERLDDIFTVLVGGARTAPRRHQALRATLDWSHDLLAEDERTVFRRLAVFSGGFTLTAAEQVAAGGDIHPQRMLELLTQLADKSLLRVDHANGDARYHLLATVRDYALERLAEAAEDQTLAAARRARPPAAALPDLQRALAAYGGDFLAGMAAGEWAQARRDELRRSFESALLATGRLHATAGRYQPAAAAFRRAAAHEPLNENAHRELMDCWARLGETARAVRHYEELVALLQEQVGVPPAAETTALYRRLLNQR